MFKMPKRTTVMYYGRLLSADSVQRLKSHAAADSWLEILGDVHGRCILRAPGSLVVLGRTDPVLHDIDLLKGLVPWKDVCATCNSVMTVPPIDHGIDALLRAAAPSSVVPAASVYICEIEHCDDGTHRVTKNVFVTGLKD